MGRAVITQDIEQTELEMKHDITSNSQSGYKP
jgi:hypothetical protein